MKQVLMRVTRSEVERSMIYPCGMPSSVEQGAEDLTMIAAEWVGWTTSAHCQVGSTPYLVERYRAHRAADGLEVQCNGHSATASGHGRARSREPSK